MRDLFNTSPVKPDKKKRALEERLNTVVDPLEKHRRALTPQEWKFVLALVDGEGKQTLKQAAIEAGYPAATANKIAHELTDPRTNPQVVAAIQQYRQDVAERYGTNIERHLRDLQIIRDKALEAGNYGAAVAAEYRRGQALGTIYVDRKEIRHGTIDSMSVDEVRRKLEEIKALYGGPPPVSIIDVTPDALLNALEAPQSSQELDAEQGQPELPLEEENLLEEIKRAERERAVQLAAGQAD
jgi:phage terminase small subunit